MIHVTIISVLIDQLFIFITRQMIIKSSQPRDETSFPAGNSAFSSHTSERMGAFEALQLSYNNDPVTQSPINLERPALLQTHYRSRSHPQLNNLHQQNEAYTTRLINPTGNGPRQNLSVQINDPRTEAVYVPTTISNVDSNETRKKYEKLSDVYSTSEDTTQFARNLSDYVSEHIPYGVPITVLSLLCFVAFVLILVDFIGAFNIPFCRLQPMIPIWLMIAGLLFITSSVFRIYRLIPVPHTSERSLSTDLCCRGTELLFALANIVWLILEVTGCVWVYGSKPYVHFEEGIFEQHFCNWGLFWIAFWTCTCYLLLICFIIIASICLLIFGLYKESNSQNITLK
uniref:MARVEL domain-containing protein n=1 Tax=Heterorhabditis bacteriophora TaxID=37862 RepID=A0A1I7X2L1_HETBA